MQFLGSVSAIKDCPLSHCAASSAAPCLSLKSAGVLSSCPIWEIKQVLYTAADSHIQTCTRMKSFTHLSSNIRLSASLVSSQVCRSFNSPRRDVTWALRASLSFVSYKHKDDVDPSTQITANVKTKRSGICLRNQCLCTWTKSFSFCLRRASVLSLWAEFFWRQSSFSWSSLYLHPSKDRETPD